MQTYNILLAENRRVGAGLDRRRLKLEWRNGDEFRTLRRAGARGRPGPLSRHAVRAGGARDALFALYAFNLEIARVRDLAREPMPGEIRLQWWREVLSGERGGEAAAHPVAAALRETLARHGISLATG